MSGTLYLVATPIGNLSDFSPRAVAALEEADFIAAEDTRVSLKLLNHFDIKKPLVSYHEHNRAAAGEAIVQRLLSGEVCALVTDAGTPAISDPGEDLVALCAERNITVTSIPGCCAGITALTLSGLPTRRFTFEGFLPMNKKNRKTRLDELPQLFNIFAGQMSVVGPRPALWNQYDLIEERDKYGANDIVPGLTGWAQVNGLRGDTSIEKRIEYDLYYIENWTLGLDIKILFMTVGAVLRMDGAH